MIETIGIWGCWTRPVSAGRPNPDGERFFYVPGAHGDAFRDGTAVIEVDTRTGDQRVVAELDPLANEHLDLTLGGSYNVAVDPRGASLRRLQRRRDPRGPVGEVVLVVLEGSAIAGEAPGASAPVESGLDRIRRPDGGTTELTDVGADQRVQLTERC